MEYVHVSRAAYLLEGWIMVAYGGKKESSVF